MSFLRPEAKTTLWRFHEALIGSAILILGLWWVIAGRGWLIQGIGVCLILSAVGLIFIGIQRSRFRSTGDGPGVVQVVEGRVAYFGPQTGGAVDIAELSRLTLDRRTHPAHWVLQQPGRDALRIPVSAKGSDTLFDAFLNIPGLRTEYMLNELGRETKTEAVIWQSHETVRALH